MIRHRRAAITFVSVIVQALLLSACNDKTSHGTHEALSTEISTEHTLHESLSDTEGVVSGTTQSTVQIPTPKSLILTVAKTSLNKDTNTTVKVMATYSDKTTKEVTDKVEWVATPKDALKVTGTTLTALKDTNVTIQAKAGTTLSNKIKLHIYWEVDGHRLPPEPDPKVNNATLLGIDSNHNGVRDDVERWIYDRYKNSHPVMIPLRMQAARAYQKIIVDPSKAYETDKYMVDAQNCEWAFTSLWANAFGRKPLVLIEPEDAIKEDKELEYVQYNTTQRARAYANYNQTLSGGVFELEDPSEKWIENCDFNTTKFIEMSEKL